MNKENIYFKDREEAGQKLAEKLEKYAGKKDVVIYALPRGGVVIGKEVAKKLGCSLDVLIIKKIGHPFSEEYAIGAVSERGNVFFNEQELLNIDKEWLQKEVEKKKGEAKARRELYLKYSQPINPEGKTAIIVDDGVATGLTILAAIKEIKSKKPKKLIVAVPVSPKDTADKISEQVDEFISLSIPKMFLGAVGAYYNNFNQVSDQEVIGLLR